MTVDPLRYPTSTVSPDRLCSVTQKMTFSEDEIVDDCLMELLEIIKAD